MVFTLLVVFRGHNTATGHLTPSCSSACLSTAAGGLKHNTTASGAPVLAAALCLGPLQQHSLADIRALDLGIEAVAVLFDTPGPLALAAPHMGGPNHLQSKHGHEGREDRGGRLGMCLRRVAVTKQNLHQIWQLLGWGRRGLCRVLLGATTDPCVIGCSHVSYRVHTICREGKVC